ncbi:MAG: SGNH/GDSL hydrolase family protein [Kiritimatiellaceae bacterium]|nr:SGNH/GDSL hydrolase family protein [Kiritimatiellaceae bacterium]
MKKLFGVLLVVAVLVCRVSAEDLKVLSPADPAIRYVGRFTDDYQFGWSGSQIETIFTGSEISATLELSGGSKVGITAVVDGKENFILVIPEKSTYPIASGLAAGEKHHILLFRRSEGALSGKGVVRFGGFGASTDGAFSAPAPRQHKLLVLGDSITCGYANEAAAQQANNTVENENGYLSYAAIAARSLDADLMMVCWSGKGMYRNIGAENYLEDTIPDLFDRTLPASATPAWNHSQFVPDVIAINLGTNDAGTNSGKEPLKKEDYVDAACRLIKRLRADAPGSKIILSIGPMRYDPVQSWLSEIAAQFDNVSVLIYSKYAGSDDQGGKSFHPSVKKHREMADELAAKVREITGW